MTRKQANGLERRSGEGGFTLIELMVSVAITLIVVVALIALFLNISRNNAELTKVNRQIESGRLSIHLLERDIAHAGFWENYLPQFDDLVISTAPANVPTGAAPDACLAYNAVNWTDAYKRSLLDIPVQSFDTVPAGCAAVVLNKMANTDVLVVRHAETCLAGAAGCEADGAGKLYFQSSFCGTQPPATFNLDVAGFSGILAKDCATAAPKRKFISDIYYVRTYATTVGDGIPTLMRSRFDLAAGNLEHQPAQELIDGVQGFRVELGLDTLGKTAAGVDYTTGVSWSNPAIRNTPTNRGDGSPDGAFVRCTAVLPCTADQLINVVAVKISVLARSSETSPGHTDSKTYNLGSTTLGPFNDNFKRHLFGTTVRLTNVAGRRETPS
jgi:type IV pilus assembly protein PilW